MARVAEQKAPPPPPDWNQLRPAPRSLAAVPAWVQSQPPTPTTAGGFDLPAWLMNTLGNTTFAQAAKAGGQAFDFGINALPGLAGIGGQKVLEALGGGRGKAEKQITDAVTAQATNPLEAASLFAQKASDAYRSGTQDLYASGALPSVDIAGTHIGPKEVAEALLPLPGAGAGKAAGAAVGALRKFGPEVAKEIPLDAEQLAARIGAKTSAQADQSKILADAVAAREGNVIQFPGKKSEAVVPQLDAPPVAVPPTTQGASVGDALTRASQNQDRRMRVVADKVTSGEPITAQQGSELLDYLKTNDPANATEYDRMLASIPQADAAAKAAGADAKATQQAADAATRASDQTAATLARAEADLNAPLKLEKPKGTPPTSAEIADATKTGYATVRDEQVLKDAAINTGKVDDPLVASTMAETIRRNPEGFAEAKRVVPLEETVARAADYLGVDIADLQREGIRRGFTTGENAAYLTAVNQTLARLGSELHNAAAVGDEAYAAAEAKFLSFSRSASVANSEAGRTLNALKLQRPLQFIEAQYAKSAINDSLRKVESATRALEQAKASPQAAATLAKRQAAVDDALAAHAAAVKRAEDAGQRAQVAALTAADRQGLGAGVRKYIASLDPNDVDSIITAIKATASPSKQAQIIDALNAPKSLLSSMDLSAPFRQGVFFLPSHPKRWAESFGAMAHALASEKFANRAMNELLVGPGSARRKLAGVATLDWRTGPLTAREEGFTSNLLGKIPVAGGVYEATNRAYTMFNNVLRANLFDDAVKAWDRVGLAKNANEEKALGQLVNWGTGRGSLPGVMNQAAPLLNGLFFAPRFAASTFETVLSPAIFLAQRNPRAAKMAAQDLTMFVGAGAGLLTALSMNPDIHVESDPRSSKFGDLTIGPHTINIWGGFQTNARFVAQMIYGQVKANDGRIIDMGPGMGADSRYDTVLKYLRGKFAPPVALGANLLAGEDAVGNPVTPQSAVAGQTVPLGWQDLAKAVQGDKENAVRGAIVGAMTLLGLGVNTDTKTGRWGVPNYQMANDPVERAVRDFATRLDAKGNPLVAINNLTDKVGGVTIQANDLPYWLEIGGKARHDAIAKAISAVAYAGLSKEDQAKAIKDAERKGLARAQDQLTSFLLGVDTRNGGALRVPTTPEREAQGVALMLDKSGTTVNPAANRERAQSIYGWRDRLGEPTFRQTLDSLLPKGDNAPTVDEYVAALPLIQQVEKMPRFANANGSQIPPGSPEEAQKIWDQYDEENKQFLAIDKRTDITAVQKTAAKNAFRVTHQVFAQYNKFSPDNPVKNKFIKDNPVLSKFY